MASTLKQTQIDEWQASNRARAGGEFAGLGEALSNLARDRREGSKQPPKPDSSDSVPAAPRKLLLEESIRPIEFKSTDFPPEPPSSGNRPRPLRLFVLAALSGVALTLLWQSYGNAAKQMIATLAPQLGVSLASPDATPDDRRAALAPSSSALEAAAPQDPQPTGGTATAPSLAAAPAPQTSGDTGGASALNAEQMERIAREIAAIRQLLNQVTVGQEQMGRDIAKLQETEQDLRRKLTAPAPRTATSPARTAPARKPEQAAAAAPTRRPEPASALPAQMAPQVSTSSTASTLPPPAARPPVPIRERF
jgi:hypothetical protein